MTLKEAAENAVVNCLAIKKGERVVVITDKATLETGNALAKEAEKITTVRKFVLEDFGKRPLALPEEIKQALQSCDVMIYAAQSLRGELPILRRPALQIATKNGRAASMPSINKSIMLSGMMADYNKVREATQKVYDIVKGAKEIKVTAGNGTKLTARFSKNIKWINSNGLIRKKGEWGNLPSGEVFTCPEEVNGTLVVDGELGDCFIGYGMVEDSPVTITISNSRISNISCNNKKLLQELKEYLKTDENSNRVGEFALGTNIYLKELIGNLLQDEKFPGIHIAFGNPYGEMTGADWFSKTHLDMIPLKPTVVVDGKEIMREGRYKFSSLVV